MAASATCRSHRHLGFDVRMGVVAFERKVLVAEGEEIGHRWIEGHLGQWPRQARELQPRWFQMIATKMRVSECVHELAGLKSGYLRYHQRQQRAGSDMERQEDEDVGRVLVDLTGEPPLGDVELEQAVARRQRHVIDL